MESTKQHCIAELIKKIDPAGTEFRKAKHLKRREYYNSSQNWYIDGFDKLQPFDFPIHDATDGFSRRMLWLRVTKFNNSLENIARMYLNTVTKLLACPIELDTDLGTDSGIVVPIQLYFRENSDSHRYVSSPRNQPIEGWWLKRDLFGGVNFLLI